MRPDPSPSPQAGTALAPPPGHPPVATAADEPPEPSRWNRVAELLLALAVIALGAVVLVEIQDIRVMRATARVGPRVIPMIVGGGLVLIGVWYAIDVLLRPSAPVEADSEDVDPALPADWRALAGIGVALFLYVLTIERLGFIIASAILFLVASTAMGSRAWLRDAAVAILLSVAVYLVFSRGLDVRLPEGVLEGLW